MKPTKMKNPQLYGNSRAAQQARRAAGIITQEEQESGMIPIFIENQHPITAVKSARKIIRGMAKGEKLPSRYLKAVTKMFRDHRRTVLGLVPEVIPDETPEAEVPNEVTE